MVADEKRTWLAYSSGWMWRAVMMTMKTVAMTRKQIVHFRMENLLHEAKVKKWKPIHDMLMFLLIFSMVCLAYKFGGCI